MNKLVDLHGFTGTEKYYKHWIKPAQENLEFGAAVYTDGVKYVAETAGAYWLLDAIFSHLRSEPFQVWNLKVDLAKKSAVLTMRTGDETPDKVTQEIPFTDFPESEIEMYLINGVLLLTSEY